MEQPNSKPTALVVNDDPAQLHLASSILTRDGFDVIACIGAEPALALLAEHAAVDLVVTDLYMPGIDGWRLCRLLRSDAYRAFNTIPIVVVSATFSGADAEKITAQLGADAFVSAPYEPSVLRQTARALLGNVKPKSMTQVLVVYPDPNEAEGLLSIFKGNGYAVTHAATGAEALVCFRRKRPHIVILDYELPDMSGESVLEAIKKPGSATVAIVVTDHTSATHVLELIRKGADSYLPKPALPEYLLHLCESASRQRALLRVEELLELRTRKLRDSEERFRSLFENTGVSIVTYALDGTVVAMNRTLEDLSGRSRDDVIGKSYHRLLTPAAYSAADEKQRHARVVKLRSWSHEIELKRPNGSVVPVEAQCRFLRGRDYQPAVIMAMYRDLTAEKKLQQQRAEFSAMLAHDIRNPVGLILGCTELLLSETGEPAPELVKKCHLSIMDDARLLQSLVNNYLDVSTIEAGQLKISKRRFKLSELLQRLVARFESEAQRRSIRLEAAAANGHILDGDELAMERVFSNLLQNAIKFTPEGGHISVTVEQRNTETVVSVRDNGPGIESEKLPVLFQKFQRIEIGERREGVGLGLYIVKELVVGQGGRVEVDSIVGRGSCFSVIFPGDGAAQRP
jgi:PAS domain S-box-containing protein